MTKRSPNGITFCIYDLYMMVKQMNGSYYDVRRVKIQWYINHKIEGQLVSFLGKHKQYLNKYVSLFSN